MENGTAAPGAEPPLWNSSEFPSWLYRRDVSLLETVPEPLLEIVPDHWRQFPAPLPIWHTVTGSVYLVIGLLATVANAGSLVLFVTTASLRTRANHLITSLTVSDLGMAATQIPLLVVNSFSRRWAAPVWMCQVYGFCGGVFGTASIMSLAMIAAERRAVLYRTPNSSLGLAVTWARIAFIWGFSVVWMSLPFVGVSRYVPEGFMTSCTFDYVSGDAVSRAYIGLSVVLCYVAPLVVIAVCYCTIYRLLGRMPDIAVHTKYGQAIQTVRESLVKRRETQLSRTIVLLVTAWCLSWTPYTVAVILGMTGSPRLTPFVSLASAVFAKASAVYNPIIYVFAHNKFRKVKASGGCHPAAVSPSRAISCRFRPFARDLRVRDQFVVHVFADYQRFFSTPPPMNR
ncbi:Ocellar opsin [Amphibalanus amphitrite]|uniref:Ocellar opsin n=1 Tax=Amphibalanus amphitrite TaxID=1232801 RepID=A0A6A4WPU3_AMPAM|nr:Ocellar opsin [Amphibalanus amphitrite]